MFEREYTLTLSRETDEALTSLAARSGITRSEALRRAIKLLFIADQARLSMPKRTLGIVTEAGEPAQVITRIEDILL